MLAVRRALAVLLMLCGVAALAVGVPAAWVQRSVFDTERYTDALSPLIAEPAVQATVSDALVQAVTAQITVPQVLNGPLESAVDALVASDAFVPAWEQSVRVSHQHALSALRDEGKGLALDDGTLSIELAPLVDALVPRLEEAGIPGTAALGRINGTFELVSSPELATAARAAGAVDRWGSAVLALGVVLLLGAVLVSPRRGVALIWAGLAAVVVSALHLTGWRAITQGVEGEGSQGRETARLVVEALGQGVDGLMMTVAVAGGAVALLGVAVVMTARRGA